MGWRSRRHRSRHLLGDPGGIRTDLENQGIYVLLDFTPEFAGNVSGGNKQGATFANQVGLGVDIDWQRLAGITGLSTHVIFVNRSGDNDSILFGDNVSPVQEIFGAGGNVVVHLVSAYAEQTLLDKRLDIAAGQMNVENDFASSPLYCNLHEQRPVRRPEGVAGRRSRAQRLSRRGMGRPDPRASNAGHLCRSRRL